MVDLVASSGGHHPEVPRFHQRDEGSPTRVPQAEEILVMQAGTTDHM
jgi:hypothetical protein